MAGALVAVALLGAGHDALAETRYISDVLRVPLRAGPSSEHRILHWGLPSGTEVEVLEDDGEADFVNVATDGGMTGWLPRQYLVAEPIARERLTEALAEIEHLSALLEGGQPAIATELARTAELEAANGELERRNESLTAELAELKSVFESDLDIHAENQRLADENETLRGEVDGLAAAAGQLQANVERQWMLIGAGLVLVWLLLGLAIKARPRRSAWS